MLGNEICVDCTRMRETLLVRNEESDQLHRELKLLRADIRVKDSMIAELRQKLNAAQEKRASEALIFEEALEERDKAVKEALDGLQKLRLIGAKG
jgi:uncharacterized coiled-coil DUF342 family protein